MILAVGTRTQMLDCLPGKTVATDTSLREVPSWKSHTTLLTERPPSTAAFDREAVNMSARPEMYRKTMWRRAREGGDHNTREAREVQTWR